MYIKSCDQTVYVLQSESPLLQGFLLSVLGKWEDLLHDNTAIVRGAALGTRGLGGGVSGGGYLGVVQSQCYAGSLAGPHCCPRLW